jgi:cyclophilin family peptidyl-prolyl cis-trans isomerase
MKQGISRLVFPDDGGRLWTWWRVAGLFFMAVVLVAIVMTSGCAQGGQPSGQTDTQVIPPEQEPPDQPRQLTAEQLEEVKKKYAKATVVVQTNKGTFRFELFPGDAPVTVYGFAELSQKGFYDGLKFHRYIPGFVIQGGDPLSVDEDPANDGFGGPGYSLPAEFNSRRHVLGTVAMAHAPDPNSGGSQFYITLAPQPQLDGQFTVFGQVTGGLDVVLKLKQGDVMKRVRVTGVAK